VSEVRISAEPRTELGKGASRRTRLAGKVPAVLYGHGEQPKHLSLPARELAAIIRHGGMTQVINVDITDGTTALALPKAVQRNPIKDTFVHVDLLAVRRGEMVTVEVPVVLTGEAAKDTLVIHETQRVAVLADATRLPEHIDASIQGLSAGERVTAGEITLPRGAELATDPQLVIAIVTAAPTAAQLTPEAQAAAAAEVTGETATAATEA
jgi:large subunit ribosomal protein L25